MYQTQNIILNQSKMRTEELFHINNNIRLLGLTKLPIKHFEYRNFKVKIPKISTDVNDKQFLKTIKETTKIY